MVEPTETVRLIDVDLPVWRFEHWVDLERFMDEMCPEDYISTIEYHLQPSITGIVFSKEPLTTRNAVAVYLITDPEPE